MNDMGVIVSEVTVRGQLFRTDLNDARILLVVINQEDKTWRQHHHYAD
jgi:hypothetical protein